MTDLERIEKLEKQVKILNDNFNAFLKMNNIKSSYNEADKDGIRQTEGEHGIAINENDSAICDVADLSDVNSQAIDDLAEIVDELSNKIAEMEG